MPELFDQVVSERHIAVIELNAEPLEILQKPSHVWLIVWPESLILNYFVAKFAPK